MTADALEDSTKTVDALEDLTMNADDAPSPPARWSVLRDKRVVFLSSFLSSLSLSCHEESNDVDAPVNEKEEEEEATGGSGTALKDDDEPELGCDARKMSFVVAVDKGGVSGLSTMRLRGSAGFFVSVALATPFSFSFARAGPGSFPPPSLAPPVAALNPPIFRANPAISTSRALFLDTAQSSA
ncbi:hypothetical protein CC2G_004840 [Coprinopsis cinerea AmutBmut pab1-1]|nr:hypothetical protein CC2G_004840 [Coprinopsis cinerea AmutBmut pab1-1]